MKKRVLFISSMGGHLNELLKLEPMFNNYNYHIVTEKTPTTTYLKDKYKNKVSYVIYSTKKNWIIYPFVLLINSFISLFYFLKYKPKYIVTTGTHTAGPMCCIGKILGAKIIYIETFANVHRKTITGRIVYLFADYFVVQWKSMMKLYPKAKYGGWIF
ncbi:MAG: polysaccharide biosynthesis protein [Bacilli bacterium]|nr:polysaccharide biosynthesis protein [Bacilli bacterium]